MATALELKDKGNACMKEGKHMEAIIHYTHALRSDPSNPQIYSNRSLAFFKEQQHFFALEDANRVVQLDPKWFKGYLRKADVEFACQRFAEAIETCEAGLKQNPDQDGIVEVLAKSKRALDRQVTRENRWPVMGIGTGVLVGIVIVFADELLTDGQPYLENILFKLGVVFLLGALGKALAEMYKYVDRWSRDAYLEPPPDVFGGNNDFKHGFFPPAPTTEEEDEGKSAEKNPPTASSPSQSTRKKRSKKD